MVIMHSKIKRPYLFSFLPNVVFSLLFINMGFAQITWQKNYGGAGSEEGYFVDQTKDGGYVVVGASTSYGNSYQVYLVKTDSLGDTIWTKTYGGTNYDFGYSVQQTTDGGYIITGSTNSFGNSAQLYLIKVDSLGDTLWTKTYGDTASEIGRAVRQTTDGGYIITGFTNSFGYGWQVYLVRTDSLGDSLWIKTFGGPGIDKGWSVEQTPDRGYIIGGSINSPLDDDPIWVIKTDSFGDTLWARIYGTDTYIGRSVQPTEDGGYIVVGYDLGGSIYLVKTDSNGDTLWTKDFYLTDPAEAYTGLQTRDKGYIVGGKTREYIDNHNFFLVKTDSLGDTLWTKRYGTGMTEGAQCVQQTADSGYILVGTDGFSGDNSQVWLIKTDAYGNIGITENGTPRQFSNNNQPIVFPNPYVSFTKVRGYEKNRFTVYDITGRNLGNYWGEKIGFDLQPGIYFIVSEYKNIKPIRIVKIK